jgi:putative addiction module component (TIGR02574 family)
LSVFIVDFLQVLAASRTKHCTKILALQEPDAMTEAAKKLSAQARKLSTSERIDLVDSILASLDEPDPNIDQLWAKEAEERLAAYSRGEIKAVSLQEVLAKYRAK